MSSLGIELKRLREAKGLTLEEASTKVGITRQYLSMLEKGQRKSASFEIMNRISDVYEAPMEYLKKFIHEPGNPLTDKELTLWNQLNKKIEDEIYYKNSEQLTKIIQAQ
ncbi:MAG TPA: helix-turn-helix transcriptional regulator [Bacillota bacterium]|nr:helix-turn-helix transcriptional regulator [Bacillota bacterium]